MKKILCRMKTGIIETDDLFIYFERKGIRGYLASILGNLHSKKPDSKIAFKTIHKAEINPGKRDLIRPHVLLHYKKNTVEEQRFVMFPGMYLGGNRDYTLFLKFLEKHKIPTMPIEL